MVKKNRIKRENLIGKSERFLKSEKFFLIVAVVLVFLFIFLMVYSMREMDVGEDLLYGLRNLGFGVGSEISVDVIYPIEDLEVVKDEFFNVTLNVSCISGDCGKVDVSLDPDDWWDDAWNYRKQITIDNANVNGDLIDFPVYVYFSDSEIGANVLSNGWDVRFIGSDGSELSYERESFSVDDVNAVGNFWVKVPLISSSSETNIWIYYGNAGAGDGEDAENVWDANFKAVLHMGDDTTNLILDSTFYNSDGVKKGASEPNEVSGKINKAQDFDGSNDHVILEDANLALVGNNDFTLSYWVSSIANKKAQIGIRRDNYKNEGSENRRVITLDTQAYAYKPYANMGLYVPGINKDAYSSGSVRDGNWHYLTGTRLRGTGVEVFINGLSEDSDGDISSVNTARRQWFLGAERVDSDPTVRLDGKMDEVRISNIVRSSEWIRFEYYNMNEVDNELSFGDEETFFVGKGLVSMVEGEIPFYTITQNPFTTSILNIDESEVVVFWVNATGDIGTNLEFFAYVNLSNDLSISDITEIWDITIVEELPDTKPPDVEIVYPVDITYTESVNILNYNYLDLNFGSCWYSKDNGVTNSSRVNAGNIWTNVVSIEGSNTWTVWCEDSFENVNSDSVVFIVDTFVEPSSSDGGDRCTPKWECSGWSDCVKGVKVRDCFDKNYCRGYIDEPHESENCIDGTEEADEEADEINIEKPGGRDSTSLEKFLASSLMVIIIILLGIVFMVLWLVLRKVQGSVSVGKVKKFYSSGSAKKFKKKV